MTQVIAVDENDNRIGIVDKEEAHKGKGVLHRAVSVILYRQSYGKPELLLQKRSLHKKLWPGFWSNTICTHPQSGEDNIVCAVRRLKEELGIEIPAEKLKYIFKITYQASYNNTFSENELDNVYVAMYDGNSNSDPEEVSDLKWVYFQEVKNDCQINSEKYTPWFCLMMQKEELRKALK